MPCLEITLPRTDVETKRALASRLTDVVEQVTGFEREIFRLRFMEYGPNEAGRAGELWDGTPASRPYLHFVLYCPRLKRSKKRDLCHALSREFTAVLQKPDWLPVIHICEHPYDNIYGSGTWLAERPELAGRKFYYDLPEEG